VASLCLLFFQREGIIMFSHHSLPLGIIPSLILLLLPTNPAAAATPEELLGELHQLVASSSSPFGQIHSLLIWHDGQLLMEEYYRDYHADRFHPVYSTTKSFTSALVGIAIEQGAIEGVGNRLLDYFPDYTPANLDSRKEAITVDHLLKMHAGFVWDELSIPYGVEGNSVYELQQTDRDWMEYILDQPMSSDPGTEFAYNSGATLLLSRIISDSTGKTTREFAEDTLFADLGIDTIGWTKTPQGETNTGWGLWLRPLDMLKFGQLYVNDGYWQPEDGSPGKQVIPSEWMDVSTQPYVEGGTTDSQGILQLNYGYQWRLFQDDARQVSELAVNDVFFSWGFQGQFIVVVPHLDLVVVTTAANPSNISIIESGLPDYIFPAIQQLAIPEPNSLILLLLGTAGVLGVVRRHAS
jgi:CubicO group peptidase (beta-lactamase class C family)